MMEPFEEEETTRVLLAHGTKYPLMEPADAVKLLYQSVFGGGHLISDEAACRARLAEEWAETPEAPEAPVLLGGGIIRLPLGAAKAGGLSADCVFRMFLQTASIPRGTPGIFLEKLAVLERLAAAGKMPFPADSLRTYLAAYRAAGCPAVHHSEAFRRAYAPAYRVMDVRFARLLPLFARLETLLGQQKRVILALDGRCASGKTTAAELLSFVFGAGVIHMDDFFLPPELRTRERIAQPGGNIHYERFREEVLDGLSRGGDFSYRRFDCGSLCYAPEPVAVPESRLTIAEGTYSLHPSFGDYADLAVFSSVDPEEQRRRITARNGAYARVFLEKWIPLEEAYFSGCRVPQRCRMLLPPDPAL